MQANEPAPPVKPAKKFIPEKTENSTGDMYNPENLNDSERKVDNVISDFRSCSS